MRPDTIPARELDNHHELHLVESNDAFICDGCKEYGYGKRFQCSEGSDCAESCRNLHYHQFCGIPSSQRPHFFSEYAFKFRRDGDAQDRYCDACFRDIQGFFLSCEHRNKDLHPWCANLKRRIYDERTGQDLVLRKELSGKCTACGHRKLEVIMVEGGRPYARRVDTWAYTSLDGEESMHVDCWKKMVSESRTRGVFPTGDCYRRSDAVDVKGVIVAAATLWRAGRSLFRLFRG